MLTLLSSLIFLILLFAAAQLFFGVRKMFALCDVAAWPAKEGPLVSLIVPACNEEENIEAALLSLVSQEYDNLEIIVVNDRSTDFTQEILDRLGKSYPRITFIKIDELPQGWFGKANALAKGTALARGDYLLFTDADVLMEKTVVARAVSYMENKGSDHLTLVFKNISAGWLLNSLIVEAGSGLFLLFKPWLVSKRASRAFIGIGAFNMLKKDVYEKIRGHETIRMHPIDDMMLGKAVKMSGFKQDCLLATDLVTVPWYGSVGEMVNGLQKNVFSVIHYRITLVPAVLCIIGALGILPTVGALFGSGIVQGVCLATVLLKCCTFFVSLRFLNLPIQYTPGVLITPFLSIYIVLKAACSTMKNNGIFWRGTHYSLKKLKESKPLFF
jgi:glycosyltransferase involved in cell wall biosynthesis